MILSHQKFQFRGKILIEKVIIRAPFRFKAEFHNEACFVYFLNGATNLNSPGEQLRIEREGAVLLKCGSYFADLLEYEDTRKYEVLVFHLYPDILRELYRDEIPAFVKPSERETFMQKMAPGDFIHKFIESLVFYFEHPSVVNEHIFELKIKELLLLLIQTKNATSIFDLFSDLFTPRVLTVREVVNNHLFSHISVQDMAGLVNLSLSTFNRAFQEVFHDTPANYIKMRRLARAKELLAVSSLAIGEIAFQTCFNDVAYFSRSFKTVHGCTPSAYRSSMKLDGGSSR